MQSLLRSVGLCAVLGLTLVATAARAQAPADKVLPGTTLFYVQVENAKQLRQAIAEGPLGQMLKDPAFQPLIEDLKAKMAKGLDDAKAQLQMPIEDILALPQGPACLAVLPAAEGQKTPITIAAAVDAGEKAGEMAALMARLTELAGKSEDQKVNVTTEDFQGLKLTSIQAEKAQVPVVWTQAGNVFVLSITADTIKDLIGHGDGTRTDSLAASELYQKIKSKGVTTPHASWFLNLEQIYKFAMKQLEARGGGNAAQVEAQVQLTGLSGLKAAGGSLVLNNGPFRSLSKTYLYVPGERQGVLRLFVSPQVDLKPQDWVPAGVANYSSISWDLDAAYKAINDLADSVAPGVLGAMEQQIGGGAADGLKFERDIFGPLGDRITILSDFKRPATATDPGQRMLFAIALEDVKGFQAGFNKIIDIANASPKKREFQGTTIYDFEIPEMPNVQGENIKGPISLAIAKDNVFISTDPALLEQVLRGGGETLANTPEYQAVAKQFPATSSTISFARPEDQARSMYDMIKGGQFKAAIEQGAKAGGGNAEVPEVIDVKKIPEFSVIAKYLSPSGAYAVPDDEGVTFTQFSLAK